MTVHMATPSEIGGSLDESEVKVIHVDGPYKGMLVVNKIDDFTLDDAIAAGQVMVQEGAVIPSTPPGSINVAIMATTGVSLLNPPNAYPVDVRIDLRPDPGVSPDWTTVRLRVRRPDGSIVEEVLPVSNRGGEPRGPFVIPSYTLDGPGDWEFTVLPPTNHRAVSSLTMLPATPRTITASFWSEQGTFFENPPSAYPVTSRVNLVANPRPEPTWTQVLVRATTPAGATIAQWTPVEDANGDGNGPFQFLYSFTEPGLWQFEFSAQSGHEGTASRNMLPVAP